MATDNAKTVLSRQRDYISKERIQKQKQYVEKRQGGSGGLFDPYLAIQTMRNVRYFNEAYAGADIVDNAIEAGAKQIHIASLNDKNKVEAIAFIDDGSGMVGDFLPWAASWGGSAQHGAEGERNVFGRFGFGLPTASVNKGRAYDIISRTDDQDFMMVSIDIDDLPLGTDGLPIQPQVQPGVLPSWVVEYVEDEANGFKGGVAAVRTVIVWRNLDSMRSRSLNEFNSMLQNHFGITYRGWLPQVTIAVNGVKVEPVDVLFTTPAARYFDVNGTTAEDHGSIQFPVKDQNGEEHTVTVRMSRLPVDAMTAKYDTGVKGQPPRIRQRIRKEYEGIFITRHDRYIETWRPRVQGISWNIYMRQVCVHLDFPPELDEMFGITPDKQTIAPREEVINALESRGIFKAMKDLYKVVDQERKRLKAQRSAEVSKDEQGRSVAEQVMDKFETMVRPSPKSDEDLNKKREEARKNLERAIKERAAKANVPEDSIRDTVIADTESKRFKVELASLGQWGPFYLPIEQGLQLTLQINVDHKFFTEVYSRIPEDQLEIRTGIELLLFTLAWCETDATGDRAAFYINERTAWSQHLLTQINVQEDLISSSDLSEFVGANSAEANADEEIDD